MNRFWERVIFPIISIANPKNIVEIGADLGYNTFNILRETAARLTVIDPYPKFDTKKYSSEFLGRLQVKQQLSLEVLPYFTEYDMILIDGDHNWYTVFHELQEIEQMALCKGDFPIIFLHDTSWPYARRDMYYIPETIPEEYRNAYAKKGMDPQTQQLVNEGGINFHLNNAIHEGGMKNGVLTAIEDFLHQTTLPYYFYQLETNNGLGVIIPQDDNLNNSVVEILNCSKL